MKPQSLWESNWDLSGHDLGRSGVGSVSTKSVREAPESESLLRNTHTLVGESQPTYKAKVPDRTELNGESRGPWLLKGEEGAL